MNQINFYIGEVIEYDDTYSDFDIKYGIVVKPYGLENTFKLFCTPGDMHVKKVPLPGEYVFIYSGITPNNTDIISYAEQWFYLTTLPLSLSNHHNVIPGIVNTKPKEKIDITSNNKLSVTDETFSKSFDERGDVPTKQLFEGDVLYEGRFGNTIRLSSNPKNNDLYQTNPTWKGTSGSPLIILSNAKPNTNKSYTIESIKNDFSSLWLTSDQEISDIEFAKPLKNIKFKGSQIIGSSDRIILQSKSNSIIFDSKKDVSVNAKKIYLGSENASAPIPRGDILLQVLQKILNAIESGTIGSGGIMSFPTPGQASLASAKQLLQNLNSRNFFIDER